eukprot:TRINITY_DN10027_c0_g1_i2.p1 TRINITY_DN10027_c0_g1~~TRINITY_DN10027_c0_g1_i2.p1  ORF type:complete len:463 (-),score=18.26 TRINITY_DN10027_c0_g1_i2:338-1726(-)
MKTAGILGLAGFLKHSQRLVVLWSPTYFSRLWCTYELAAWFRYERSLKSVLFVPVEIPMLLLIGNLLMSAGTATYYVEELLDSQSKLATIVVMFLLWVLFSHALQGHIDHVGRLRHDLDNFSLQCASCFCCSNNHRHPETGLPMPCDRTMVYRTLQEWMSKTAGEAQDNEHLSTFNTEVRTTLKRYVTGGLPERHLFLRYADMLFMAFPVVWVAMDCLVVHLQRDTANRWLYFCSAVARWLVSSPLTLSIHIRLMYAMHRRSGGVKEKTKGGKLRASCFWGISGLVLHSCLTVPLRAELYTQSGVTWALLVAIVLEALISYCLFRSGNKKLLPRTTFSLSSGFAEHDACSGRQSCDVVTELEVEPMQLGRPCSGNAVKTSAVTCLRQTAHDHQSFRHERDKSGFCLTAMSPRTSNHVLEDDSIGIPFDASWQPVSETSTLTALGPVYRVDLGRGEIGFVIRL